MVTSLFVALALLVTVLVVAIAYAWQGRRRVPDREVIYGVEDALEFVTTRLSDETRRQVAPGDVRRILEWELRYLQDPELRGGEAAVVGGIDAAEYAQQQAMTQGHPYDGAVIIEVLELQAQYLAALGAVGPAVDADEAREVVSRREGEATG